MAAKRRAPSLRQRTIISFGSYHDSHDSAREGDAPAAAFAAWKAATTVYVMDGIGAHADRLARLGAHPTGVGCSYIKNLAEVDLHILEAIMRGCYATLTVGTFGQRAGESGSTG